MHELLLFSPTFGKDSDIGWESTGQMMRHDLQMIIFFRDFWGVCFSRQGTTMWIAFHWVRRWTTLFYCKCCSCASFASMLGRKVRLGPQNPQTTAWGVLLFLLIFFSLSLLVFPPFTHFSSILCFIGRLERKKILIIVFP